jgi:hypothetical protein
MKYNPKNRIFTLSYEKTTSGAAFGDVRKKVF